MGDLENQMSESEAVELHLNVYVQIHHFEQQADMTVPAEGPQTNRKK